MEFSLSCGLRGKQRGRKERTEAKSCGAGTHGLVLRDASQPASSRLLRIADEPELPSEGAVG